MNLAGFLRKNKYTEKHTCTIIREICEATKDNEFPQRLTTIKATYKKPIDMIKGYSGLKDIVPQEALKGFKEKKNEEEKEVHTSFFFQDNKIYEQIYQQEPACS
jgi:predicted oxidoreductase (fatty acid repression mutant protein)